MRTLLPLVLLVAMMPQSANPPETTATGNYTIFKPYEGPTITINADSIIEVKDKDKKLMVRVERDGKIIYGEGYKAEESAKTFWEILAKAYPPVCEELKEKK